MTFLNLIDYLNQNYIMLVPALWVLGFALKQTPAIPDWLIIWILFIASITVGSVAFGFSIDGLVNGITAAGVAVLGHQMYKQTKIRNSSKKSKKGQ
ncbi:phage holin family protein [Bacillus sp. DTU_2020_1000418_1_SI_GHA_SEK_038]|uniref:phage holin family protein n=1 Tax=Bacillus sp. DTU_2020_1000418_1_SI_GHA_SEK_038 TaxID=3077585 RepID=UPI0028E2452C|nr:phage holin family protein [Bacillus sp. DTU_2020_1000418_1_SI_GHA_SEK_038]WNS77279.1 phage holin family protein [Bacillus sp. DTU_2020_1000418_1_SI_GHA_SEK_038]